MKVSQIITAVLAAATATASAAPVLFDMGTNESAVWPGFTRVTPASIYSDTRDHGWKSGEGLKATVNVPRSDPEEMPPVWTNAITEDVITGDRESRFLIRAEPGEWRLYIVCGSCTARREQFHDFTVQAGGESQRVQIEGPDRFLALKFRVRVDGGPIEITFSPRSKFIVNAIMAWQEADDARVNREIIAPFEQWTWLLPPAEWAKWQQDPAPPAGEMPPLTEQERQRGCVLYSRPWAECIYPDTKPRPEELNPELRAFATPGEYEPLNFAVHPLRDLADARVTISDIGPIAAKHIDIRHVRYMRARPNYSTNYRWSWVPDVLEHFDKVDLKAGQNERFWLTVHVPEGTPAGLHEGRITFTCAGGLPLTLPVRLRVLPFKLLEDPEKIFGIYYHHPLDRAAAAKDEVSRDYFRRRARLEHADIAAHGTHHVTLTAWCPAADAQGHFAFNWDLLAEKIALWREFHFTGPMVMSINTGSIYYKYMKASTGSHLKDVQDPPAEFEREVTALVRTLEEERVKRGWPEFLYYPYDEPGTSPAAVSYMVKLLKACKAAGVRTYVTADSTHDQFAPMRPYVDVWCSQPFAPDRETVLADHAARGVEYWCYPNHISGENNHTPLTGARMTYGFGFWRSGFRTLIPWIYSSSSGDPFNYLDSTYMDFLNRHEPDGTPVPVALWEAFREGCDDYRYIHTLARAIAGARQNGSAAALRAADTADRELKTIWDAIRVQPKYKDENLWPVGDFDIYRWIIAQQIMVLQAYNNP